MSKYLGDLLLLAGCACIVFAAYLLSVILAWFVGGVALIALGYMWEKAKASIAEPVVKAGNSNAAE